MCFVHHHHAAPHVAPTRSSITKTKVYCTRALRAQVTALTRAPTRSSITKTELYCNQALHALITAPTRAPTRSSITYTEAHCARALRPLSQHRTIHERSPALQRPSCTALIRNVHCNKLTRPPTQSSITKTKLYRAPTLRPPSPHRPKCHGQISTDVYRTRQLSTDAPRTSAEGSNFIDTFA